MGDRVLMINGMATYGLTHPEFVTLLAKAGEDGKVVTVTVSSDAQTPSTASESPTPTTVAVFSPGERVSALYLPEEKFYDAVIVSIDRGRQSATVEYIGCVSVLVPSGHGRPSPVHTRSHPCHTSLLPLLAAGT